MRPRYIFLLLSTAALFFGLLIPSSAQAQDSAPWSPEVKARSSHLAEVNIVNTTPVELDGTAYTIAEAEVIGSDKGSLPQSILIQVEGGLLSNGGRLVVSHQPFLSAGDRLDVALISSPSQWAATAVPGAPRHVFSIVGGIEGVSAVGSELYSQAQATGDFSLTGTKFGSFPVDFYVNPANSGVAAAATIASVRGGLQSWESDPASDIKFTYRGGNSGNRFGDGKNTIYWTTTPNPADSFLAQALWKADSSGNILEFDIKFNRDYPWAAGAAAGRWDIATVMRHESGHALGFNHVIQSSEVMFDTIIGGRVKGLGAGDLSGAAHLYPTSSEDPARIIAAAAIVDGLESYANADGNYTVQGAGWAGTGQGWFRAFPAGYPSSIRNVLSFKGHFPAGAPTDPNLRDFLIYRCENRIGVFADTDSATSDPSAANWWAANNCTQYPAGQGYSYLALSAAVSNDPARIAAVEAVVDGLESYANTNGDYTVAGAGWGGTGQGWFRAFPAGYPSSIRNVLSFKGHFPAGAPTDPNLRDFLIYRC